MKDLTSFLTEKKYDYHCIIPPFQMEMILKALDTLKEVHSPYNEKQIEDCIHLLHKSDIE